MKTCPHCNKEYSNKGISTHIWRSHGNGKNHNPNIGFKNKTRKQWNSGLTSDTSDIVKLISSKLKGKSGTFLGKHHTKETKDKLSKSGGYRRGSGHGKKGFYKGIWCDSSWELAYVIYNLEHNISFKRNTEKFKYIFEGKTCHYIPDYRIENDTFVEIKGYKTDRWEAKKNQFKYKLIMIEKNEIAPILEYVIGKYGKDFIKLYE